MLYVSIFQIRILPLSNSVIIYDFIIIIISIFIITIIIIIVTIISLTIRVDAEFCKDTNYTGNFVSNVGVWIT